jgi:hypothetical protein
MPAVAEISSFEKIQNFFNPYRVRLTSAEKWVTAAVAIASLAAVLLLNKIALPALVRNAVVITGGLLAAFTTALLIINWWVGRHSFDRFAEKMNREKVENSDIILILKAKDDYNKALNYFTRSEQSALENQDAYKVVCKTVSTVKEFKEAIHEQKLLHNKIHVLWVLAHGDPDGFDLGREEDDKPGLNSTDVDVDSDLLLKTTFQKVEKHGVILLDSCSTGGKADEGRIDIAERIANLAKERLVIAPTVDTSIFGGALVSIKPFNYVFREPKYWHTTGIFSGVTKLFWAALFVLTGRSLGTDITARFNAKY